MPSAKSEPNRTGLSRRSEPQTADPTLVPAQMVGELMAQGPLDLTGEEIAIVAEIAFERVPVDDDPVLVLLARDPVAEVLAICAYLGPEIGHHHRHPGQHLLEFVRQPVDRIDDQRLELVKLGGIGHAITVARGALADRLTALYRPRVPSNRFINRCIPV
jgi:hypothetical protein